MGECVDILYGTKFRRNVSYKTQIFKKSPKSIPEKKCLIVYSDRYYVLL